MTPSRQRFSATSSPSSRRLPTIARRINRVRRRNGLGAIRLQPPSADPLPPPP